MRSRTIAIGDIHGCALALDAVLTAISPRGGDMIVTLGDYVSRGPDSRRVIDRLINLSDDCASIYLLGNHDEMYLRVLNDRDVRHSRSARAWLQMGGAATLASYGIRANSAGQLTRESLAAVPEGHRQFLARCASYHENDAHIFVHANYDRGLAMDQQPEHLLRWESLRDGVPGPHVSGKRVIAGHSSQKSGEILDVGHLVCIDTYCYGGGWLTALDVDSGETWQADRYGAMRSA